MMYVKPVSGRLVRHPETGEIVPAKGMSVPRTVYWLRRLKDGDVLPADPVADGSRAACRADSAEAAPPKAKKEPMTPKE